MRRCASVLIAAAATLAGGCERPFVAIDPPAIEIVSPDLSEVLTLDRIHVVLRVTSLQGVSDVTIAGQPTTRAAQADLFLDTLALAPGLNSFPVEAIGADGNVARDTIHAFRASLQTGVTPSGDLPEPRGHHAAVRLADGSVLVSGGVGPDGTVRSEIYVLREVSAFTFDVTTAGTLASPRTGHTGHLLPDGRVVFVGGSTRATPASSDDFVAGAEIFDPATGVSTVVPATGDPVQRSGHASFLLEAGGRAYLYIVGGRGPLGQGVGTPSSVVIVELNLSAGAETLVTLTPPGGAGVLEPVTAPAGVLMPGSTGGFGALVAGLYEPEALTVASRLTFLPGSGQYPYQVLEEPAAPPDEPRDDAAASSFISPDIVVLTGGRDGAGVVSATLSIYADPAHRFFRVPPDETRLRVSRYGHTATLLPSGRIALIGGYTAPGNPIASTEVLFLE